MRLNTIRWLCGLLLAALTMLAAQQPASARFLQPDTWDPWLVGVDTNRYAYAGNDPINGSDPGGHSSFSSDDGGWGGWGGNNGNSNAGSIGGLQNSRDHVDPSVNVNGWNEDIDTTDYGASDSRADAVLDGQKGILKGFHNLAVSIGSVGCWCDLSKHKYQPESNSEAAGMGMSGNIAVGVAGPVLGKLISAPIKSAPADLQNLASQVHNVLDPIARNHRATAVLQTNKGFMVSGGVRDLTPAQRDLARQLGLRPTKQAGMHAEPKAINAANRLGERPIGMAVAGRSICPGCSSTIEGTGGRIIGQHNAVWP